MKQCKDYYTGPDWWRLPMPGTGITYLLEVAMQFCWQDFHEEAKRAYGSMSTEQEENGKY